MTDTGTTLCEACGTALLDDEPSCWRCGHHPGVDPAPRRRRRPDGFIFLVLGAVASMVALFAVRIADQLPPDLMTDLPSCVEEEGVSERFTEIWRFSMDATPPVLYPEWGGTATIDPVEKVEGLASARVSVPGPSPVQIRLGSFPLDGSLLGRPLDGRTLVVRARIRAEGSFPAEVTLGASVSGADSFSVGPLDIPANADRPWRLYELTYVGSPDHEGGRQDVWLVVPGPGTVWIDDVRILRGPRFEGTQWNRLLVTERVQRPAAGVERVLDTLITEGSQDVLALIQDADEAPLFQAFEQRPEGAEPPDRVQRCLTELYLAMEARERPSLLASLWMDLARGRRISPAILHWRETIHGFHQPDYLERLVRLSPSTGLVATYGRDVVPPMIAHGPEILGLGAADPPRGRLDLAMLHSSSGSFVEMTALLLREADAGRWELSPAERLELRVLLEARLSHVPRDQQLDLVTFGLENRELLESVLRRLGSEAVGPAPDSEAGRNEEALEATSS